MGSVMYLVKQGNTEKRVAELEQRLQALENLVNGLQLELKPKRGRPPKENHGQRPTEGDHRS